MALLTGSNGSGKTTLLRCLSTALTADFGQGSVGGFDLIGDRDRVRLEVSTLTHPAGFYGGLSARENLELAAQVVGAPRSGDITHLLERVGLSGKPDQTLDSFSSGMKQRFALARLCLMERALILLDEPETHLDSMGLSLLQVMIGEWKARGATIICATHSPDRFGSLADQEVRLLAGRPDDASARP